MTANGSSSIAATRQPGLLQAVAPVATLLCAVGSVTLQLYAGRRSPQHLVMFLIAGWVIAPFVALLVLNLLAARWRTFPRKALHAAMVLVSIASLAVYILAVVRPPASKPAFPFVATPPASLMLTAIVLTLAWLSTRKHPGTSA